MSIPGCWRGLVFFMLLAAARPKEDTKEFLRHQQSNRPSFISRKLVEAGGGMEKYEKSREASLEEGPKLEPLAEHRIVRQEGELDTSVEKSSAQIRHGRSRYHLARQVKIGELPEAQRTSARSARLLSGNSSRSDRNILEEARFGDLEDAELVDSMLLEDTSMLESRGVRANEDSVDASRYGVLEADLLGRSGSKGRAANLGSGSHEAFDGGKIRTISLSQRRNNSLERLRKVVLEDKQRAALLEERFLENTTESFGRFAMEGEEEKDPSRTAETSRNYESYDELELKNVSASRSNDYEDYSGQRLEEASRADRESVQVDIVTRFLRIIENQHLLGENCTAGTDLNLGEGVVDQYAQERFRLEANLAVNRANMLTRLWKYAPGIMLSSEYLLHASVLSMVEFDEDIFAAGNCYDKLQYKDRWLFCPFAHRLQDQDGILVKDLAIEYKYLSNSSEWFYIARKNAERVIANNNQFSRGECSFVLNESSPGPCH
ncbi:hypothetical protein KM043_012861 [Ampulex compressa]|nr:hypothetical protein KM043_012861 [Ampulex compressa]